MLAPETIFLRDEDFFSELKTQARWVLSKDSGASEISNPLPPIAVNRRADDPLSNLRSFLLQTDKRILICAETAGRRETLQQYFRDFDLELATVEHFEDFLSAPHKLALGVAPIHSGFQLQEFAFITEAELYAGAGKRIGRKKQKP